MRPRRRQRTPLGSNKCICPKCGYTQIHSKGVPCTEQTCPQCGAQMKGENC